MDTSPQRHASYAVPVRQASVLPSASFSLHLTVYTLPLGYVLPLNGRTRDLHPIDVRHAWRTIKKRLVGDADELLKYTHLIALNTLVLVTVKSRFGFADRAYESVKFWQFWLKFAKTIASKAMICPLSNKYAFKYQLRDSATVYFCVPLVTITRRRRYNTQSSFALYYKPYCLTFSISSFSANERSEHPQLSSPSELGVRRKREYPVV